MKDVLDRLKEIGGDVFNSGEARMNTARTDTTRSYIGGYDNITPGAETIREYRTIDKKHSPDWGSPLMIEDTSSLAIVANSFGYDAIAPQDNLNDTVQSDVVGYDHINLGTASSPIE